jgi:hypothetical protein
VDDTGARELARALLQAQDEAACVACLDLMGPYVEAQLAGQEYTRLFPAVARHLDGCVACAEAYGLLFDTLAAGELAAPAQIPEPDLSFLGPAEAAGPAELLRAALADALRRAAAGFRITLTRPLLELLTPAQGMGQAVRGSEPAALLELALDEPAPQVAQLLLSVYPAAGAPEACDLRVQVRLQGRDWPDLAGVAVAVTAGELRREAATDGWGEALIEGLPRSALEGLQIEVRP